MSTLDFSGLPIIESGNKLFSSEIKIPKVDIRKIDQAKDVLLDRVYEPEELYYMYRDVSKEEDKEILQKNNLRYDITIIPALKIGCEFNKTIGHYHDNVPNQNISYPEIYEVLKGKAHYILQKVDYKKEPQEVLDFFIVEASFGDKVIIPPDYGHVTINPGPETLVMANFLEKNFQSIYKPFRKAGGAVYFETIDNQFIKNKNYKNDLGLNIYKPVKNFPIPFDEPMYKTAVENPKIYEFITTPQKYLKEFENYLRYLKK